MNLRLLIATHSAESLVSSTNQNGLAFYAPMKKITFASLAVIFCASLVFAQSGNGKNNTQTAEEKEYREAMERDPRKMNGRFDLGRLLVEQGRLTEARVLWNERKDDSDTTYPNFITVLVRAEKLQAARKAFNATPNDPETILQMGYATMDGDSWVVDGRHEKAIVLFKKALKIKPDFAKAQFAICKAYVEIAAMFDGKDKVLDKEIAKLRKMDIKLADEIATYRESYSGGITGVPAVRLPSPKP